MTALIAATAAFTLDAGGEPLVAYLASGEPAQLNVVATRSGRLVGSKPLSGGDGQSVSTRALATGTKDRRIYIGLQDGRAYSFDVDTQALTLLPTGPGMKRDAFWNAGSLEDGRVLFTTYPTARLLAYNPKDETWRDFGRLGSKNKYAMGVSSVRNIAYVGTGTADPALWQVDTAKGTKRRISLPSGKKGVKRDFVYDTTVVGTRVFARVDSEKTIYCYNAKTPKWVGKITGAVRGLASSENEEPAALYWVGDGGDLHRREESSGRDRVLAGGEQVSALRGYGWQRMTAKGGSSSLVTINTGGDILRWNADQDELTRRTSTGNPAPVEVRSLGVDSQGKVLVGGYGTTPYFATLNYDGGAVDKHPLRGQVEAFGTCGRDLLVGTYPGAGIHLLRGGPLSLPDPTPRWQLKHGQDRPVAIEDLGGGRAAIASVPVYGKNGGALTLLRVDGRIEKVITDIAPNRSPLALAHRNGLIYVGTGATGGLGANRDTGDGSVIMADARSGEIQKSAVPVSGDANISALKFDEAGTFWGWSVDTIFELDPDTLGVKRKKRYSRARDTKSYVRGRNLVDLGEQLAGSARGKVFLIDKTDLSRRDIARGNNVVLGGNRELYYSRGAEVFRWTFGPGPSA